MLFGEYGNSGLKTLTKREDANLFIRGQTNMFLIECADLGNLHKLHVEHDNSSFFNSVIKRFF